jgi:hypothetical protein
VLRILGPTRRRFTPFCPVIRGAAPDGPVERGLRKGGQRGARAPKKRESIE